jgi:tetratricopeptide (TPR) repeat protein
MFRQTLLTCCLLFALALMPTPALAQDSWVGKSVLTKKPGIKITDTDKVGKQAYVGTIDTFGVTVLAEKDGLLKVRVNKIEGWFSKSDALLVEDAIPYFTDQITKNPNDAEAYTLRAAAWAMKREYDTAIKDVTEGLRISPTAKSYSTRADFYQSKNDRNKAISDYTEAIRIDPKEPHAYVNRGVLHKLNNEIEKALSDFSEAIRLDPNEPHAYANRAMVYGAKKEYDKAISDLSEVIRLDPKFANVYYYGSSREFVGDVGHETMD